MNDAEHRRLDAKRPPALMASLPVADYIGPCRACGAQMIWAKMGSGKLNPLDAAMVEPEAKKGIIAFNPRTGAGCAVTLKNIEECGAWARKGASFHVSHFATCSERQRFRR